MQNKRSGFNLKPLVASLQRHRLVPLYLIALGMSAGQLQAAETSAAQDSSSQGTAAPTTQLQRVEVTGSAIRRVDAETAVPITILSVEQLRNEGVTTTAELMQRVSGNQSLVNAARSVGSSSGGSSFADMRGIGANKTLVLLNGRRLGNNAVDGSAVDLNTIPFAAIERVEVLRDGASALYGTDAIGGVINFITKKSLTDGSLTLGGDTPSHSGGGSSHDVNASWGYGDLEKDRFNVFGVVGYNKQDSLQAKDRSFSQSYVPGRGLDQTSGVSYPANYSQNGVTTNPLSATGCNGTNLVSRQGVCRYNTRDYLDLVPETEKTSFFGKATGKITDDDNVNLEYFWARNNNAVAIAPSSLTGLTMDPTSPYFPGNGITPASSSASFDPTQPIGLNWRETAAGGRSTKDQNTSQRLVLSFDGLAKGWDYNLGASYNQNSVTESITGGFVSDSAMIDGIANGIINPFGPQSAAGQRLIDANQYHGQYISSVGRVSAIDGRASREIGDWFGAGPSGLAVGGEYRQEKFHQSYAQFAGDLGSLGVDPDAGVSGDRTVKALYTELNVPVLDSLELSAAVRHDKYSDFGSTTNPKYSFRYQPVKELVVRGAYSEGFRAPSLYELYNPQYTTYTQGFYNDPRLCTGGTVQPGGDAGRDCGQQFHNRTGGNTDLSPETARNLTLGFVYQPVRELSVGLDFWWIHIANQIAEFPESTVFDDPNTYADRYIRNADGSLNYVQTGLANLGAVKTSGVDVSVDYKFPNTPYGQFGLGLQGTYVSRYDYQTTIGGSYTDKVSAFQDDGMIARWKHVLSGTWNLGAYRASLVNRFTSSYKDANPDANARVASYTLWDISGGYTFDKTVDLDVGVKNLFDRDPPFTNQAYNFQSGYDPRYADPLGRTFFARATYHF
ncbi:TonB-dependent receptor [Pseudomonas sp. CCC3.1]|uniref:TonB-dependent receptor n=1 Tax=Pseudomonas sp. CCC3.1 TaxID=3048607 RepID=UPI002AC8B7C2|nr:TonB-dependent receptor [Pseudomonas sp. CCC3.1]MEB0208582.1 TonB-dependent receptor [Pseudomonas sp. CCC3.1]WPX38581.1 TonB-dependent receptor [Pseudomonas sp. CCC3.1]